MDLDQNNPSKKILESLDFNETEFLIDTDTGWQPLSSVHITQPYTHWKVVLENGYNTICADHHLFFDKDMQCIEASTLLAGDKIQTIDGLIEVKYCYPLPYKSSMFDTTVMSIDHRYYGDNILSHNTVSSSIFITWYLLFNTDKNVMVMANKGATAAEILDKIKAVVKGLPFFLKPGIIQNNVMTIKLDNGCRVMGQATTKTAAIGFTLHLVYMDEFAHIQPSFLESFYRSVYPTISASKVAKIIITSTPHGRNKFYEIYQGAIDGKNEYSPQRVDWWEVPERDEEWKAKEIANLGSIELFNQEYGNQFLASETLLLGGDALRAMKKMNKKYKWRAITDFEDTDLDYSNLLWHPKFSLYDIDKERDRFVFSIDIADGAGQDYSIINIFKVAPLSKAAIRKLRSDRIEDESSLFRLVQVGVYRCNKTGAEDLAKICEILTFEVLNPDIVRIALEVNFKGDVFIGKLSSNPEYYEDIFLHTKHNTRQKFNSIGIKLHKHNKMFYCREFRKLVLEKRIVLNEQATFEEMNDFGINNRGVYSSQSGHDDLAMTSVNLVPMITSYSFSELIEDIYENMEQDIKNIIQEKLANIESSSADSSIAFLLGEK